MPLRLLSLLLLLAALPAAAQEFGPPYPLSGDFQLPSGVAVDPGGRVLVADTARSRIRFAPLSSLSTGPTWSDFGFVMDFMSPQRLHQPLGLAADSSGNVWVTDTPRNELHHYRFDAVTLTYTLVSVLTPTAAGLPVRGPRDVAVDASGRVYLLDTVNFRVLRLDGPSDTTWDVWRQDMMWGTCSGLDVAPDGMTVFLASTSRHQVLQVPQTGTLVAHGRFGTMDGELNGPRDVARLPDGRFLITDTNNHRVVVMAPGGTAYTLAADPWLDRPERIAVHAGAVHVVDSSLNRLVSFLPGAPPAADIFVRDYEGDPGNEESPTTVVLASPDLLVRNAPDVDLTDARLNGLSRYAFQQPRAGQNNYVYVAVRNHGTVPALGVQAHLYQADPMSMLMWPSEWETETFYRSYTSDTLNERNHALPVPPVPARTTSGGVSVPGFTVVGPLVWRPAAPRDARTWDGRLELLVRLVQQGEPAPLVTTGLDQVRRSNNLGRRQVLATRGSPRIGPQDTLVVRTRFSGSGEAAPEARVQSNVTQLQQWVEEVSYGRATVSPRFFEGPLLLAQNAAFYNASDRDPLVELTQEVLDKVYMMAPQLVDGDTTSPEDDLDRIMVVLNDPAFPTDRAITGDWEYTVGGVPRRLSVSVHGPDSPPEQYAHAFSHQFGLVDLHVDAPRVDIDTSSGLAPPTGNWDVMAQPAQAVHPLAASKALAPWLEPGSDILFIPRPASPRTGQPPIRLHYQSELQPGQYGAIAVGLTPGVTAFSDERAFYFLEARSPTLGNADMLVPQDGVLVYYVNRDIPQGHAPVLLRDAQPGTPTVNDAALGAMQSMTVSSVGLTVAVVARHIDAPGGYDVRIDYTPPPLTDVYIRAGEPAWASPDIWVDFPGNGLNADPGNMDQAVANTPNRVYARVYNNGDTDAYDVEVRFSFSDPHHTAGGADQFVYLRSVIIPRIPARGQQDAFILWTPRGVDDPHRCVLVELRRTHVDSNPANNSAQKNLQISTSTMGAMMMDGARKSARLSAATYEKEGFSPVAMNVQLRNTSWKDELIYFRVEGVPAGWATALSPEKHFLAPEEVALTQLQVQPPQDAALCKEQRLHVTAWAQRGDTLTKLGGSTLEVATRLPTTLWLEQYQDKCQPLQVCDGNKCWPCQDKGCPPTDWQLCRRLVTKGCVSPQKPGHSVYVEFREGSGVHHYAHATTDSEGCFTVAHQATEGGEWQTTATYEGGECQAPARAATQVYLELPTHGGDQDQDGVPDKNELHGDYDGDGRPNVTDRDSDNDGITDGQEKPGDSDRDGLDDVIDPYQQKAW